MVDKFEKRTNCEYCDKPLDAKYRSKRFCDDKCRIYWNREQKSTKILDDILDENKEEMNKVVDDILEGKSAITKTDTNGKMKRVDPLSEEGGAVMDEIEKMIWEEEQKILNKKNK